MTKSLKAICIIFYCTAIDNLLEIPFVLLIAGFLMCFNNAKTGLMIIISALLTYSVLFFFTKIKPLWGLYVRYEKMSYKQLTSKKQF